MKTTHQSAEITMSNLSMVMSFKCSYCCKVVFEHSQLRFNVSNAVLIYRLVQNNNILFMQCALMHIFFGNGRGVRLLEHVR